MQVDRFLTSVAIKTNMRLKNRVKAKIKCSTNSMNKVRQKQVEIFQEKNNKTRIAITTNNQQLGNQLMTINTKHMLQDVSVR